MFCLQNYGVISAFPNFHAKEFKEKIPQGKNLTGFSQIGYDKCYLTTILR